MRKVTSMFEAIETLQEGIDSIEMSNLYRPETDSHEKHYNSGIESLKAAREFLLDVKFEMGNFTTSKYVK